MSKFIEKIACGVEYDPSQVIGYSEEELEKIERLYDIKVAGQLRKFLLNMGRSDGGLIGDDPIYLYRPRMSIRRHIMFQLRLETDFKEFRIQEGLDLIRFGLFVFSWESETQYFFVATKSKNPDSVYHYDENNGTVQYTGMNILEYMKQTVQIWGGKGATICQGDILIV